MLTLCFSAFFLDTEIKNPLFLIVLKDKEHQERSGSGGEDDEGKVEEEEEEGKDEPQGEEPEPETTLFVKNINFATTDADLNKVNSFYFIKIHLSYMKENIKL